MMESCRRLRSVEVLALRMSRPRSAAHLTESIFSNLFRIALLVISDRCAFGGRLNFQLRVSVSPFFAVPYAQREKRKQVARGKTDVGKKTDSCCLRG